MTTPTIIEHGSGPKGRIFRRLIIAMLGVAGAVILIFGVTFLLSLRSLSASVETSSSRIAEHTMEKDLNVARAMLDEHQARVAQTVASFAQRSGTAEAVARRDDAGLRARLQELGGEQLHFLTVLDARGVVLTRSTGATRGDDLSMHPLVRRALTGTASRGLWLESAGVLQREGLAERARIKVIATEHASESGKTVEDRGLIAGAVLPIKAANGQTVGVVMGGFLHNRDYQLVDSVRQSIYKNMESVGTATLFLDDVRISTNVHDIKGDRAIGTRISKTVGEAVLAHGQAYRGRAFVVRDWYVAGYEPLRDVLDQTIGILYVGVLEGPIKAPFMDMYHTMRAGFVVLLGAGAILSAALAILLSMWLARRITRPISSLTTGLQRLSTGDLTVEIRDAESQDELGELQSVVKTMTANLRDMVKSTREGIHALTASTSQIAVTAKQSQATAAEQATAVQEVGSTIQEISLTSNAVVERAQEVVQMSEHAVEGGQRGIQAVDDAQRGLELLAKIAEIVDTVNELAEQSNVLAVNAAIEAAKAGERGKGFAVVAGEVRSLAGQSKKAARQIREILARVESSGTAITHASTVIRELGDVLERTADRARQIAAAAGQQAAGMKQIGSAMEQVVQGGRDTADGARQLESAVTNLSVLASQLSEKGARYKV